MNTCRSSPHLLSVRSIRLSTSRLWSPSAEKMDPRYLKSKIFFRGTPSHRIFGLSFWASASFSSFTLLVVHSSVRKNLCLFAMFESIDVDFHPEVTRTRFVAHWTAAFPLVVVQLVLFEEVCNQGCGRFSLGTFVYSLYPFQETRNLLFDPPVSPSTVRIRSMM